MFETGRVVIQGDPASPILFNIVVDALVQAVLDVVFGPQEAQHGMNWASRERNRLFYADDVRISGQDHDWVQDVFTVSVAIFRRMCLDANLKKTKAVLFMLGFIWWKLGETAYK